MFLCFRHAGSESEHHIVTFLRRLTLRHSDHVCPKTFHWPIIFLCVLLNQGGMSEFRRKEDLYFRLFLIFWWIFRNVWRQQSHLIFTRRVIYITRAPSIAEVKLTEGQCPTQIQFRCVQPRKWTLFRWTTDWKNSSTVTLHTRCCIKASVQIPTFTVWIKAMKQYELDSMNWTTTRLRSAKSPSSSILFCHYLFCFRALVNSSDNAFNRLQMCAAPAAAAHS